MKRNLYYKTVLRRTNSVKMGFLSFFLALASWPRLLLEVFIRKNFGERYFSLATAVIIFLILAFAPMFRGFARMYSYGNNGLWETIKDDPTWYIFLVAFLVACYFRQKEVQREPSVFDFARYSLSSGNINPFFYNIKMFGKEPDPRTVATILEPGFFFIVGLALFLMKQPVGVLIIICSICYSLGYMGAYYQGDEFVMDRIDEMICNEEMFASFVEGKDSSQTRGFNPYTGRKPADRNMRQKVADSFTEDIEHEEVK